MPDMTMCIDSKCPSRETCYRYQAKPSTHQSYADFQRDEGADKCLDGYEPMEATERKHGKV